MTQLNLIHLGLGDVGKAVRDLIINNVQVIKEKQGMDLVYCGFFTSKSGYYYPFGFPFNVSKSYENEGFKATISNAIERVQTPFAIIDTTASESTTPHLLNAMRRGGYVVMSNKKPLTGTQEEFNLLHSFGENRVHYETTVCASLPVINTLQDLLVTGDVVKEINGCLSGTLSYICAKMENGVSFSQSVKDAVAKGHSEADPRDDLSGLDVARKALIMARIMGYKLELTDVHRDPLYPPELQNLPLAEFLDKLSAFDDEFRNKFTEAKQKGNTLRYTATISENRIVVKLSETPLDSQLGRLKGLENIVIYTTKRYNEFPLVIQGPVGSTELAAGGVLSDILKIGK